MKFSGAKLREARKTCGLKQADLAVMLDVGYRTYQGFEANTAAPSADTLALAALLLKVPLLDLYDTPPA